ncbi:MAG: uncharacterized protein KVP18_000857 [Porospora cf. gigantea A]|uniref:uncharacterized protein n=1 Tax=Porospora cf. gigantea A TaxID=2853593 RepID=UPI00355973A5|nr:MAG: hypothetical protein KVP18_000857 [Porospora cf. gigantea A]
MWISRRITQLKLDPVGGWTNSLVWKSSLSTGVGAVVGLLCAMVVNVSLVEISLSPVFATYFGLVFFIIGLIIGWRIHSGSAPIDDEQWAGRRRVLVGFVGLVLVSALLCFVLQRSWFLHMHFLLKVPTYITLGTGVSFSMCFALVDMVNAIIGFGQASYAKPLIDNKAQVQVVIFTSLLMGGLFGLIFGLFDVEDEFSYQVRLAMMKETKLCYPIGIILGGGAGFTNEYLRQTDSSYLRIERVEYDSEI